MQIVFVHQNYPAQFGHIARYLAEKRGHECIFVSREPGERRGVSPTWRIQYQLKGGATKQNHYCSRTFENAIWHAHAVYEAITSHPEVHPDLIVGHSGFGSTLFLHEHFSCPLVNYFEYFYHTHGSDMDFRPEFASKPIDALRARARNAMILLDLDACNRGYSPTEWQRERFPKEYQHKLTSIFDGIDTTFWAPNPPADRKIAGWTVPDGCRLVTYAARGFEAMRGFDIFLKAAQRLSAERPDVIFAIAGEDRVCYGNDTAHLGGQTIKQQFLASGKCDPSRFRFLGLLPPAELAKLFALSDLHFYLTVPFVLSWSLMNALSCGATVVASGTPPVREVIQHEQNGLIVDFFDVDGFVKTALSVLENPAAFKHLGAAGRQRVEEKYSYEVCLPRLAELYEITAKKT